jgi:hypothetical protein
MLQQAAQHMTQAQSGMLITAMRDADALDSVCSNKGLSMKGVYPSLRLAGTIDSQAREVIKATLNQILPAAHHEQFIASFFTQLKALRGWPEYVANVGDIGRSGGAVQYKAGLTSDAKPQSEASELARMVSPAAHMEYLSDSYAGARADCNSSFG